MEARLRWILVMIAIAGIGLMAMLPLMKHPKHKTPAPEPSRTSMRTAAPKGTVGTEIFPSCEASQMPCVDKVGNEYHLFESVPGKPARETFVTVFGQFRKNGKLFYEIYR